MSRRPGRTALAWPWLAVGLALVPQAFAQAPAGDPPSPVAGAPAPAQPGADATTAATAPPLPPGTRSGREIYERFRSGLAEPDCPADSASPRWRKHYAAAPARLAGQDQTLALFGYVVDALRDSHLPTEYALIPFVESGYKPGARSPGGPAGLWQFIALTARNHKIPVRAGYDGRLSPVASTRAAVRYLKTLHGMFAGDWRLAAMAYNAGEYRIFGALRRSGQVALSADPERLPGLSGITRAYPRKIHALSCLLQQTDDRAEWMEAIDRPVPLLAAVTLPGDVRNLDEWAARNHLDAARLRQLNPAFAHGRIVRREGEPVRILAQVSPVFGVVQTPPATGATASTAAPAAPVAWDGSPAKATVAPAPVADGIGGRTHVVARGDSLWTIARRYGVRLPELLAHNHLDRGAVLQPGMLLHLDGAPGQTDATPPLRALRE